jgi:hypothetical protein
MAAVPMGLLTISFLENVNKFQNPFRHLVATTIFKNWDYNSSLVEYQSYSTY